MTPFFKILKEQALTVFIILTLSFFIIRFAPGSPLNFEKGVGNRVEAQLKKVYGLDQPLYIQYLKTMKNLLTLNFGPSISYPSYPDIPSLLKKPLIISFTLGFISFFIAFFLAFLSSVALFFSKNRFVKGAFEFSSQLGTAIPVIVLAPLLILIFSLHLKWFPPSGWSSIKSKILPIVTVSVVYYSIFFRLIHSGFLEVENQLFVFALRLHGIPEKQILFRHSLKPALTPFLSYLGPSMSSILTGSFVVEKIFNIPGLSTYFVEGVTMRDYPLIMAITFIYAMILVFFNTISELLIVKVKE